MKKVPKKSPCPCGSGRPYKYCHIGLDLPDRILPLFKDSRTEATLSVDLTNDFTNLASQLDVPIKNFCKDNDFYYFAIITVGQSQILREKLQNNTLSKADFFEAYKTTCTEEPMLKMLDACCVELDYMEKRRAILTDAFQAHFNGLYTLSIPTLFAQLEGVIRDFGNIPPKENVRPVIPLDIWEPKLLFYMKDNAINFNAFTHKLFAGSGKPDEFNRNPILHGFNVDYFSEEHSLLLMLSIIEIRMFDWHDKNTDNYVDKLKSKLSKSG